MILMIILRHNLWPASKFPTWWEFVCADICGILWRQSFCRQATQLRILGPTKICNGGPAPNPPTDLPSPRRRGNTWTQFWDVTEESDHGDCADEDNLEVLQNMNYPCLQRKRRRMKKPFAGWNRRSLLQLFPTDRHKNQLWDSSRTHW